jgi:hypothetical protein
MLQINTSTKMLKTLRYYHPFISTHPLYPSIHPLIHPCNLFIRLLYLSIHSFHSHPFTHLVCLFTHSPFSHSPFIHSLYPPLYSFSHLIHSFTIHTPTLFIHSPIQAIHSPLYLASIHPLTHSLSPSIHPFNPSIEL